MARLALVTTLAAQKFNYHGLQWAAGTGGLGRREETENASVERGMDEDDTCWPRCGCRVNPCVRESLRINCSLVAYGLAQYRFRETVTAARGRVGQPGSRLRAVGRFSCLGLGSGCLRPKRRQGVRSCALLTLLFSLPPFPLQLRFLHL